MKRILIFITLFATTLLAQVDTYNSGGPLLPEQAAYNVTFYELALTIDPASQSISGSNTITTTVVQPFSYFVLDFDARFTIDSVFVSDEKKLVKTKYERRDSKIYLDVIRKQTSGTTFWAQVYYHGKPIIAPNPPWDGGFTWSTTSSGQPWVSVSCQTNGADIWWPCKDHPSDEPDSMALHFTVPEDLQCISSGQLRNITQHKNGTQTFHWFVSTPINNYGLSFYIGPYEREDFDYKSVDGDPMRMSFYYLPEHLNQHKAFSPQIPQHVRFLEELLGPYPFRIDKYAAVEAPYFGMEHQSCIAYGNLYGNGAFGYDQGFDPLHFHELSHEWWGNMLTASDWKDFWLHEGFATYMEALYAGYLNGQAGYDAVMQHFSGRISNRNPMAPTKPTSTEEIYGNDIYFKGAWVLHTLRYVIGDDLFFESLQRFLYPDPSLKKVKDGSHCRLVSSEEFIQTVERVSKQNLDWFFNIYLRQAQLPILQNWIEDKTLHLAWKTPDDEPFLMNVQVKVGDQVHVVDMSSGHGLLELDPFVPPNIDPEHRILKVEQRINTLAQEFADLPLHYRLEQNYPNPFNSETTIEFTIPEPARVQVEIFNMRGERVETIVNAHFEADTHRLVWDAINVPSGTYTYKISANDFVDLKKLILIK